MAKALDVRVAQNGRMVLPKAARDALGLTDGGTILVSVEGNEVTLTSMYQSVRLAQQLFSLHVHVDLTVDHFLVERRAEAGPEKARD
jgi:AbrB family looped-hinge helix DNA binding protein